MRLLFGTFLFLVIVFAAIELNRWRDCVYIASLAEGSKERRIAGSLLLFSVGALCFAGTYLPSPFRATHLEQAWMMIYWGVVMLLAVAIPVVGYLEAKSTMLIVNREMTKAYRETLLGDLEDGSAQPDEH